VKALDLYLRDQRFRRAASFVRPGDDVLDVGCEDGALLTSLRGTVERGVGIDAALDEPVERDGFTLLPGRFPEAVPEGSTFDAITMLAVLEHIPPADQQRLGRTCAGLLRPAGRVIITVPSPLVDHILHGLRAVRLVEAETLHEHYGFEVANTPGLFTPHGFEMVHRRRFQLGLNNVFVFERR
jgi:2-polyprenyl-3-methyl-5-hydroxy-6-metoxy-1,4-benzoquinol methylase